MFAGYRDEVEGPTAADDGVFIPQKELTTWWKQLQKKFPAIYPPEEVSLMLCLMSALLASTVKALTFLFLLFLLALSYSISSWDEIDVL